MNRKVKVRGKRLDNGEWIYSDESYIHTETGVFIGPYNEEKQVDPDTVGWFTDTKDKNGEEIYEGDLLVFDLLQNGDFSMPIEVVWDSSAFWAKRPDRDVASTPLIECYLQTCKIVGNVHDNPEYDERGNTPPLPLP